MATDTQSLQAEILVQETEIELSVVMPCLNEAETLATCIRKTQQALQIAERLDAPVVHVAEKGY